MPLTISSRASDVGFQRKVREISGQNFGKCYQCGTCSGSCPMGEHLDTMPRQLMALLQLGQRERLDNANTPWICASCHACMVRCPRGIDIPKVMEAMRQVQLRDNVDKVDLNKLTPEQLAQMPQIALVSGFRKMTS